MAGGIEFNRGKFKELVLFFADESAKARDEGFGMVKLNKLLFRADFEAYRLLGRSITGETYEKQEFGPVARDLPIVLDELGRAGRLDWRNIPLVRQGLEARPDVTSFTSDELRIIKRTLSELATHGGKSVSDWSHEQSAGWNVMPHYGDEIDYATTFISTDPVPDEDLKRATAFVHENGWV
jgi:hypothetical protein